MSEIRSGKPQYTFIYEKGGCFFKTLYDKRGNGRWDLGILFETGILMAENADYTKLKGFNMGMFSVETLKFKQGTDNQQGQAMLQLLDATEFNARHKWLPFTLVGDLMSVQGAIENIY